LLCNGWVNADALLRLAHALKLHDTVDHCEERVVTAYADIASRMHLRAALAYENASGSDPLSAEALDAEALRITIAPVARTSTTFFVSHPFISRPD
jgi:hypothetical protein